MCRLKALLLLIGLLFCLFSCKKDTITDPNSVVGRWIIVSITTDTGVGFNNHSETYTGQQGDYYEFTANGILYTKKGSVTNTLNYTIVADTSITIKDPSLTNDTPLPGRISTLTAHNLVIYGPYLLTPGGIFGSTLNLSR